MRIVLGTCSSERCNADCDYALVDLTPKLVSRILKRMELVERLERDDPTVHELLFWDGTPEFFAMPADQQLVELLPEDGDSYCVLPADQEIPENCFQRTEGACLVVGKCGPEIEAYWRATPKHVVVCITTASLPRSVFEGLAGASTRRQPSIVSLRSNASVVGYALAIGGLEFRRQRQLLLRFRRDCDLSVSDKELIDGLISLTDTIADQAHDRYGIDCLLGTSE